MLADGAVTWDRHARARIAAHGPGGGPRSAALRWTRDAPSDPGVELLGDVTGRRVADLGCGAGDHLGHLVALGADGVGVDAAPGQIERARARWPGLDFRCANATAFLAGCGPSEFDIAISCFGAFSFTPHLLCCGRYGEH